MGEPTGSKVKTFRLGRMLIEKLDKAARRAHLTESALVNQTLESRLLIDPLLPALPRISLSAETFQCLISTTDLDALEEAGADVAKRNFKLIQELFNANGYILTFRDYITEVLGKYSQWFYVEGGDAGGNRQLMLRHSYGPRWSIFVRSYLLSAYSTISKDKLDVEIGDQFIRIESTSSLSGNLPLWRESKGIGKSESPTISRYTGTVSAADQSIY
jgi:hypothetical protein